MFEFGAAGCASFKKGESALKMLRVLFAVPFFLCGIVSLAARPAHAELVSRSLDEFVLQPGTPYPDQPSIHLTLSTTVGFDLDYLHSDIWNSYPCTVSGNCSSTLSIMTNSSNHVRAGTVISGYGAPDSLISDATGTTEPWYSTEFWIDYVHWRPTCGIGCDTVFRYAVDNIGDNLLIPFAVADNSHPATGLYDYGWINMSVTSGFLITLHSISYDLSGNPVIAGASPNDVPVPGALALLGAGLAGLGAMRRRKAA